MQFILIGETTLILLSTSKPTKDNTKIMDYINKQNGKDIWYKLGIAKKKVGNNRSSKLNDT